MSWNYRVMRYKDGSLGIHEVYYAEDNVTVTGWSKEPESVTSCDEKIEDLWSVMSLMTRALMRPILEYPDDE